MSRLKRRAELHSLKGQVKVLKPQFLIQGSGGLKLTVAFPGIGFSSMSFLCVWLVSFGGFMAAQSSLQDLSSPTRDQTRAMAGKAQSPNHWTAREFPSMSFNL